MKSSIAFRVDASLDIGSGHVMRCLTLADALHQKGARCMFLCRPYVGHLMDLIEQRGHEVIALPTSVGEYIPPADAPAHAAWLGTDWATDAAATRRALGKTSLDWLVVDHYALDQHWEQALRPDCNRMMVIDDLADRLHDCDVLLDQNLGRSADDYSGLVSEGAKLFIGPSFALLRPEFARLRSESLARRVHPALKRLLITMGGVDKDNVTGQVLHALQECELPEDLQITVVIGPKAPWLEQVTEQVALMRWPVQVLAGVSDMARLMVDSDLAIGAAGSTAWERCCLGLPTIQLVLADNQKGIASALVNAGAAVFVELNQLPQKFSSLPVLNRDLDELCAVSCAAQSVTDGSGTSVVTNFMLRN